MRWSLEEHQKFINFFPENMKKTPNKMLDSLGGGGCYQNKILEKLNYYQGAVSNQYQAFVRSGIKAESPSKAIKGQLFLGQKNFIEEIKHLLRGKEKKGDNKRTALSNQASLK